MKAVKPGPVEDLPAVHPLDTTRPPLPTRSRLFRLEPIGIGTPLVESLTSYVGRLAAAHHVSVGTLLAREILPLARGNNPVNKNEWMDGGHLGSVNGIGPLAQGWVDAVGRLTMRSDTRWTTMLPWDAITTFKGLLRPSRAWCPRCYGDFCSGGAYEPLLWALEPALACPVHRTPLQHRCPHCEADRLPRFSVRFRNGCCSRCDGWLGTHEGVQSPATDDAADPASLQTTLSLSEMLAAGPSFCLASQPTRQQLFAALRACARAAGIRTAEELAAAVSVHNATARWWLLSKQAPELGPLLRLAAHFGMRITEFLGGVLPTTPVTKPASAGPAKSPRSRKFTRRLFDGEAIRPVLQAALDTQTDTCRPRRRSAASTAGTLAPCICTCPSYAKHSRPSGQPTAR